MPHLLGKEMVSHSFIHSFIHLLSKDFPSAFTYHVVCLWSLTAAFLYYVMHVHCYFAVEAPFGMKFNKKTEVFNPPPTSAASSGPRIHSIFAFIPSWPKKTLFKRESAVTHHLVSNMFSSLKDISEVVKKPILDHMCRKCQRLLFLQKTYSSSFTEYSYHWEANPSYFPESCCFRTIYSI